MNHGTCVFASSPKTSPAQIHQDTKGLKLHSGLLAPNAVSRTKSRLSISSRIYFNMVNIKWQFFHLNRPSCKNVLLELIIFWNDLWVFVGSVKRMVPFCLIGNFEPDCVSFAHLSVLQAEIVKRLNAICAQVIPFLSQEVRLQKACQCELRLRWVRERENEGG